MLHKTFAHRLWECLQASFLPPTSVLHLERGQWRLPGSPGAGWDQVCTVRRSNLRVENQPAAGRSADHCRKEEGLPRPHPAVWAERHCTLASPGQLLLSRASRCAGKDLTAEISAPWGSWVPEPKARVSVCREEADLSSPSQTLSLGSHSGDAAWSWGQWLQNGPPAQLPGQRASPLLTSPAFTLGGKLSTGSRAY